jgi:hypothetical protein
MNRPALGDQDDANEGRSAGVGEEEHALRDRGGSLGMAVGRGLGMLTVGVLEGGGRGETFYGSGALSGMCVMVAVYRPLTALLAAVSISFLLRRRRVPISSWLRAPPC